MMESNPETSPGGPVRTGWPRAAGLLVVSLIVVFATGVAQRRTPRWELDKGAVAASGAARFPSRGARPVVVATFADARAARDAFVAAGTDRPEGAGLALFGQTILVAGPPGPGSASGWMATLVERADEVLPGREALFSVTCHAADREVAAGLAASLGDFFALPASLRLVPPWASPDRRAAGDRARQLQVRRIFAVSGADADRLADVAPALGVLPAASGATASDPHLQFASAGRIRLEGRRLRVEAVAFDDLFRGPAALVAWLRANACAAPRYRFEAATHPDAG